MLDMYPLYVADERRTNTNLCDGICARHRARRGRIPLYIYTHALASSTIRKSLTRDIRIGGSGDGDDLWRPPSSSLSMYPCTTDYVFCSPLNYTEERNGKCGSGSEILKSTLALSLSPAR